MFLVPVTIATTVISIEVERIGSIGALNEVLSLVRMHGSMAWPNLGPVVGYRCVRQGTSLHVWVAPVRESLVWIYQVWILAVDMPVRPLEHWVLGVHDPRRLNRPVEKLQKKAQLD